MDFSLTFFTGITNTLVRLVGFLGRARSVLIVYAQNTHFHDAAYANWPTLSSTIIKVKKERIAFGNKEHKITKIGDSVRLSLIESIHMHHCSLRGCIRPPPLTAPSSGFSGIRFLKYPGWAQ